MIEREAINIKDMTKVLDIDASGQKGHWVKVSGRRLRGKDNDR